MENFEKKEELNFSKTSPGPWGRIFEDLTQKLSREIAPESASDMRMKAIHAVVKEEVFALLENNAEFVNSETLAWTLDLAHAEDPTKAEEMKVRRLQEILNEKAGGNLIEMLSQKI